MKNTICIFFSSEKIEKILSVYEDVIQNLPKKYETFYFVNFYNITNNNKKNLLDQKRFEKKYNIKIFCPQNKKEFNEFTENRLIFAFDDLGKSFKYFKVRALINKDNIKLILFQNIGYFSNQGTLETNISIKNFFYLIKRILVRKIYRLMVFFKFFSPIFLYFECRRDYVNNCQLHEKKFNNKNKIFNFLYFENTILINSRSYDKLKKNQYNLSNSRIIFIDGNYEHLDVLQRENLNLNSLKDEYFKKLKVFLKKISLIFDKEIFICLHPNSNIQEYKKFFSEFNLGQFETEKNIYSSFLVIFHESSSIDTAIFLKKRIISLQTNLFGKYFENRINKYKNELALMSVDLNEEFFFEKKEIYEKTKVNENKYNNYIRTYLKSDDNEDGISKLYRTLNEKFNLINK